MGESGWRARKVGKDMSKINFLLVMISYCLHFYD